MSGLGSGTGVSVIIPTHDRAHTLDLTIASIQAQTITDIEIIIAGDGVTTEVRGVIERLCAQDSRIRFLDYEKAPGRGYENRHRALLASTGEYIFYSDDDDLWLPDHVEKLRKALSTADVADSAVVSVARSGRIHRAFANHSHPAQRQLLASTSDKKITFDTHLAHKRSLYLHLGDVWVRGVAELLSGFAASDAVWATFNGPTALSLHGSVRNQDEPSTRREEALHVAASISTRDVEREATGVWYLYRMLERLPPAPNEDLRQYLQKMGIACSAAGGGDIVLGGEPINPKMAPEVLVDLEMTFGLFRRDIMDGAPLQRILLPLAEPLLSGGVRVGRLARDMVKALPEGQAMKVVSDIPANVAHDIEIKTLFRAQLLLMQRNAEQALPLLEASAKAFTRYAPDAILMLARHATRQGMHRDSVRRLRDASERFGARNDIRVALATALLQSGQTREATELLETVSASGGAADLLARLKRDSPPQKARRQNESDRSRSALEDIRAAFARRDWGVTIACFERFSAISNVPKGRKVEAISLAARAYVALEERGQARKLLKQASSADYDKPHHYEFLVVAFMALKNYREASRYCLMAEKLVGAAREQL
jgi:tetratricopeptide (TPR) repeat protein